MIFLLPEVLFEIDKLLFDPILFGFHLFRGGGVLGDGQIAWVLCLINFAIIFSQSKKVINAPTHAVIERGPHDLYAPSIRNNVIIGNPEKGVSGGGTIVVAALQNGTNGERSHPEIGIGRIEIVGLFHKIALYFIAGNIGIVDHYHVIDSLVIDSKSIQKFSEIDRVW